MRLFRIVAVGWALVLVTAMTVAAMSGGVTPRTTSSLPQSVATHSVEVGMLERDMQMLEQMRVSASPSMNTMIAADRMWVDPEMIRAQEQYQAELDRMIGRP